MDPISELGATKQINFHIQKLVEIARPTEKRLKQSMSLVWDKNIGEPCTFNVVIASRLVHPQTREALSLSCEYVPNTDIFQFAMDTIKERMNFGLPEDQAMIILAAHEAMHKVQVHRGEHPKSFPITQEVSVDYFDSKHEIEAWEEALHVFKKIFPKASGGFTTGNKRYTIPEKSKY